MSNNPQTMEDGLSKHRSDLLMATSQETTIVTNAFDFAAQQCRLLAEEVLKLKDDNKGLLANNQKLDIDLKKLKDEKKI